MTKILDKIAFRGREDYTKMYHGSELIAEVKKEPVPEPDYFYIQALDDAEFNIETNSPYLFRDVDTEIMFTNAKSYKNEQVYVDSDIITDLISEHPNYLVGVVDKSAVSSNTVKFFTWRGPNYETWPGVDATLFLDSGGYLYYYRELDHELDSSDNMIINLGSGRNQTSDIINLKSYYEDGTIPYWDGLAGTNPDFKDSGKIYKYERVEENISGEYITPKSLLKEIPITLYDYLLGRGSSYVDNYIYLIYPEGTSFVSTPKIKSTRITSASTMSVLSTTSPFGYKLYRYSISSRGYYPQTNVVISTTEGTTITFPAVNKGDIIFWDGTNGGGELKRMKDFNYVGSRYEFEKSVEIKKNSKLYINNYKTTSTTSISNGLFKDVCNFNIGGKLDTIEELLINATSLFNNNKYLKNVDNISYSGSKNIKFTTMFYNCDLGNVNINVLSDNITTDMYNMFNGSTVSNINFTYNALIGGLGNIASAFNWDSEYTTGTIEFTKNSNFITSSSSTTITPTYNYYLGKKGNITFRVPFGSALPKSACSYTETTKDGGNRYIRFIPDTWILEYIGNENNYFGLRKVSEGTISFGLKRNSDSSTGGLMYSKDSITWIPIESSSDGTSGTVFSLTGYNDVVYLKANPEIQENIHDLTIVEKDITSTTSNRAYSAFGNISNVLNSGEFSSTTTYLGDNLFNSVKNLISAYGITFDLNDFPSSKGLNMSSMFSNCIGLISPINKMILNKEKYTDFSLYSVYSGCSNLITSMDFISEDNIIYNITMTSTYSSCSKLKESNNAGENITLAGGGLSFTYQNSSSLVLLPNEINILGKIDLFSTFTGCKMITTASIKYNADNFVSMTFYNCEALRELHYEYVGDSKAVLNNGSWMYNAGSSYSGTKTAYLKNIEEVSTRDNNTIPSTWTIVYED